MILFGNWYDIVGPLFFDPRPGYPFNYYRFQNNPILIRELTNYPLLSIFLHGTNLGRLFFRHFIDDNIYGLSDLRHQVRYRTPNWENDIARIYVDNMIRSAKYSSSIGANFVAYLEPLSAIEKLSMESDDEVKEYLLPHIRRIRDLIDARIASKGGNKLQFLDFNVSDILDNSSSNNEQVLPAKKEISNAASAIFSDLGNRNLVKRVRATP